MHTTYMFPISSLYQKGSRKNEVFVDVLERLTVLYTPNVSMLYVLFNYLNFEGDSNTLIFFMTLDVDFICKLELLFVS